MKVGDTFYLAHYDARNAGQDRDVTVKGVGRKYATIDPDHYGRVVIATMRHDAGDYSSRWSLWPSKEAYDAHMRLCRAHTALKQRVGYYPPEGVTLEDVRQAAKLLRIDLGQDA